MPKFAVMGAEAELTVEYSHHEDFTVISVGDMSVTMFPYELRALASFLVHAADVTEKVED